MEQILIYTLIVSGWMVVFLYLGMRSSLIALYKTRFSAFALRRFIYPYLYRRFEFLPPITVIRALFLTAYCAVTFFYNAYMVGTIEEASSRAGWLSVINTIPLLVSGRIAMVSKLLGVSLHGITATHMASGIMVAGQALAHVVLELRQMRLQLGDQTQRYGFMGAVAMATLILTLWLRRSFFELFTKTHASLALFTAIVIFLHVQSDRGATRQYMAASILLYAVVLFLQIGTVMFRNLIGRSKGARAYLSLHGKDGIKMELNLEKAMEAKPGQFIYVWMACSPFQIHPFMIVSEKENTLTVLVQSQRGFSHKLKALAEIADPDTAFLSWIDGPYGNPPDFQHYQSVFLVANGIGVAAHLLVLKMLVAGFQERSVRVRSIKLYWHVDSLDNRNWVKEYIDEIIKLDETNKILEIIIYYPEPVHESKLEHWSTDPDQLPQDARIKRRFDQKSFLADLSTDIRSARGDTIVSVSARNLLRDKTREHSVDKLFNSKKKAVTYHVSDFQVQKPLSPWHFFVGKYR